MLAVRVLLVEGHEALRDALYRLLIGHAGISVVGEVDNGRSAVELAGTLRPDVVVVDSTMPPGMTGLETAEAIKRSVPSTHIVMVTGQESRSFLQLVVKSSVTGCVLKSSLVADLRAAVTAAARGESFLSSRIATAIVDEYRHFVDAHRDDLPPESHSGDTLTEREAEVLQLAAEGLTNGEIAARLGVSVKTVETHRLHLMRKLDIHDRVELVKYAIRAGVTTVG